MNIEIYRTPLIIVDHIYSQTRYTAKNRDFWTIDIDRERFNGFYSQQQAEEVARKFN